MKIGLIGCGGMGTTHNLSLKALSGKMDVEVTALADCRQEFLERAAKQWPGAKTYTTGMELLREEELDAVHICLPSYLHAEHAIAAMEKGDGCLSGKAGVPYQGGLQQAFRGTEENRSEGYGGPGGPFLRRVPLSERYL